MKLSRNPGITIDGRDPGRSNPTDPATAAPRVQRGEFVYVNDIVIRPLGGEEPPPGSPERVGHTVAMATAYPD